MAANAQARKPAPETMAEFVKRRAREVAQFGMAAETAARNAYGKAIRDGRELVLKTQGAVNRYGAEVLSDIKARSRTPAPPSNQTRAKTTPAATKPSPTRQLLQGAADQALAAARGAQDAITLGGGDRLYAGTLALIDAAAGQDLRVSLDARLAAERERDAYDAKHFGTARTIGEIGGTAAGLLAFGPTRAALTGGTRMAAATALTGRDVLGLTALGAGGGVIGQLEADGLARRQGSLGDYAGAAIGGTVGVLGSLRARPGEAAALAGATTSMAQDALNNRAIDLEAAGHAALAARYVAAPLGKSTRVATNAISVQDKGRLGENLGRKRSLLNGDLQKTKQERVELKNGRTTVVDHKTRSGLKTEQKFGPSAKLTPNQRQAREELGDQYRVDHFLPQDVGVIVGLPAGFAASEGVLEVERE